jgi:hypothetical protein
MLQTQTIFPRMLWNSIVDVPINISFERVTAMTAKAEARMTSLFDQAVQTFGDAMKAGVKMQEEMGRWWSDAIEQAGPVNEWQKRSRAIVCEAIPAAQHNTEEFMKVMEQNYRRSLDLLKKAVDSEPSVSPTDVQTKTQELWDASMEVVRDNAQAMAQVNVKMMETWAELLKKNMNGNQPQP